MPNTSRDFVQTSPSVARRALRWTRGRVLAIDIIVHNYYVYGFGRFSDIRRSAAELRRRVFVIFFFLPTGLLYYFFCGYVRSRSFEFSRRRAVRHQDLGISADFQRSWLVIRGIGPAPRRPPRDPGSSLGSDSSSAGASAPKSDHVPITAGAVNHDNYTNKNHSGWSPNRSRRAFKRSLVSYLVGVRFNYPRPTLGGREKRRVGLRPDENCAWPPEMNLRRP